MFKISSIYYLYVQDREKAQNSFLSQCDYSGNIEHQQENKATNFFDFFKNIYLDIQSKSARQSINCYLNFTFNIKEIQNINKKMLNNIKIDIL